MKILSEQMRRIHWGKHIVRLWLQDEGQEEPHFQEIRRQAFLVLTKKAPGGIERNDGMAKALIDIEGVAAVEIVDQKGDGVVLYKNWP